MFPVYPYLNINDLNLDYILKAIREMRYEVTNFVSINAIKYADPIQWDITRQYEKNTVVIDPITGTAYISVAPVPAGVALTRPEYWTVVFDLGSFVTKAAKNFTDHYEDGTTLTATFNSNTGDWLVWGDVLYKALVPITAGDAYVENSNIEHFTMEDLYNTYLNTVAAILAIIGDLADLTTSDTTSIVNAINSIVSAIGDLATLTTSDTSSIVNAINEIVGNIGDLNNLTTSDKTSIVNAINEVNDYGGIFINVAAYGATGDGVTDDTAAIIDAIAAIGDKNYILYFPAGTYVVTGQLVMPNNSGVIFGAGRMLSTIKLSDNTGFVFSGAAGVEMHSLGIVNATQAVNTYHAIDLLAGSLRFNFYDMFFYRNYVDIYMSTSITEVTINGVTSFDWTRSSVLIGDTGYCGSVEILNSFFKTQHGQVTNGAVELKYVDVINMHGCTLITPLSNNVLIEPESGQTASLITFDGNCFDTSENGIQIKGAGRVTRLIINGNTVQEMDTTGFLLNNGDMDYVVITDNVIFNTPYGVNLAENCIIEDCDISNNIFTGDTLALRLAGTATKLKVNENIIGTTKYGLTMANGIVTVATIEGVAFGNVFNNVTTPIQNNSANFYVYDYPTPYTPTDPRIETPLTITTDTNGNAVLTGFTDSTITMLEVKNLQGDFIMLPYWDNTNQNWYVHVTDVLMSPIVSTPFNAKVVYIDAWS